MKKTVAIIGSHPATRGEFDWEREDCDVWGFNEVLNADWFQRADAIFQMHKPVIWRSATNRNDPKHYAWLKSGNTPVIYMQDKYSDVPLSEKFPLDEILKLSGGIDYFTSSVAYALALAIYKGYTNIEVYGVEMETNTEYGHQRVGVAFWVGLAIGRGINVEFHSHSVFVAPLYGYEGDISIPIEYYRERLSSESDKREKLQGGFNHIRQKLDELLNSWVKTYKTDLTPLDELVVSLSKQATAYGMSDGAVQANQIYADKCQKMLDESGEYLIVRQEYEGQGIGATKKLNEMQPEFFEFATRLQDETRKSLNTNDNKDRREKIVKEFKAGLKKYINMSVDIGRMQGIIQENSLIIQRYDQMLKDAGVTQEQSQALIGELQDA